MVALVGHPVVEQILHVLFPRPTTSAAGCREVGRDVGLHGSEHPPDEPVGVQLSRPIYAEVDSASAIK